MDDSLKEIRFITARGVVYILNDPPQTWLRFINPDEPEANFPPDQSTGRLVRYEVSIGKPASSSASGLAIQMVAKSKHIRLIRLSLRYGNLTADTERWNSDRSHDKPTRLTYQHPRQRRHCRILIVAISQHIRAL